MRVAMIGSEWFASRPGGLNRYYLDLARAFSACDDVVLDAAAFGHAAGRGTSLGDVGSGMATRLAAAREFLTNVQTDVLDTHFALYALPSRSMQRSGRWRGRVVHFHGPWALESKWAGDGKCSVWAKKAIEKFAYREADRLVVLSEQFKQLLTSEYGVDSRRIRVIPPAVDTERFSAGVQVSPEQRTVVVVRRLERRMGIDVLLRAWANLHGGHDDVILKIVGDGGESGNLHRLASELGVDQRVHFTGRVSDDALVGLYRAAQLSVVPSVALEGFGLIALESMACGTPSVVSDCGGLSGAVKGLDPGLLVPPGDVSALAERLRKALDGELPTRSAVRAHAEKFGLGSLAAQHVALYREILSDA